MTSRKFSNSRLTLAAGFVISILFFQISPALAGDGTPNQIEEQVTAVAGETPVFDHQGESKVENQDQTAAIQGSAAETGVKSASDDVLTAEGNGWTVFYAQGWESSSLPSATGWNVYGGTANICWDDTTTTTAGVLAHTGTWSMWPASGCTNAVLPGSSYPNSVTSSANYGPFDLSKYSDAKMDFWYNNVSEKGYDFFCFGASGDNITYTYDCVSGDSGGWVAESLALKPYIGDSSVWVNFYFYSDASNGMQGPYVDDIVMYGSQTATFLSNKTQDGWVLESTETSSKGGTMNSTEKYLRIGDDTGDRQYRSILSFNTAALPDGAIADNVTILLKYAGVVGNTSWGAGYVADIRKPNFSASPNLDLTDFQAAASSLDIGWHSLFSLGNTNWYELTVGVTGGANINNTGTTQFRIKFVNTDNDNNSADYLKFFSANGGAANIPKLVVQYHVP